MTFEVYVNDILRPLRAANRRKAKMREELLSHLAQVRDELRDSGIAQAEACAQSIARMGSVEDMRAQLQASVPAWERTLQLRMGGRRNGESDAHYAARLVLYAIGSLACLLAIPVSLEAIVKGPQLAHAVFFMWFAGSVVLASASCFITFYFDIKSKRAYASGNKRTSYSLALLSIEIPMIVLCAIAVVVGWQLAWTRHYMPYVFLFIAAFGIAVGAAIYFEQRYLYPRRPWVEFGRDI
jgi:hypothetical protein